MEPTHPQTIDANGVNLSTGEFELELVEGTIGSGQGALSLIRYSTVHWEPTSNWDNFWLEEMAEFQVTVTLGDRTEIFTKDSGGVYVPDRNVGNTLTDNGTTFTYRDARGTAITFGTPPGVGSRICTQTTPPTVCIDLALARIEPNGASVNFQWEVQGNAWRLDRVQNSFGYEIDLNYSPSLFHIRTGATLRNLSASGSTPLTVSYVNNPSTGALEITDAGGRVWQIGVSGAHGLAIRRPDSTTDDVVVARGYDGIVTSVTRDGVTTNYSRVVSIPLDQATMTVTNALGQETVVVSDPDSGLVGSITDPLNRETGYGYDEYGRLVVAGAPEDNSVQYLRDTRGNVYETRYHGKPGSGAADIVTRATYPPSCSNPVTCNQPTTTTDARGNVTEYEYDPTHGGVTTVTAPAPTVGATRPQTRYSYTLTHGEHQLTGVSTCRAGAAPSCVGTSDETRTVIGYDANGNVTSAEQRSGNTSGAGALSATSTTTYDAVGNLLTVDGPLAGTADTTRYRYNSSRQVVGVIGPDPDGINPLKHRAVRTTYRLDGLPTRIEQGTVNSQSDADWAAFTPLEEVQTEYDVNDRPRVQRLVSGSTTYALTQTSYDELGRVRCVAQRMNPNEFGSLPSDNCTLDTEGSHGPDRITRTTYDEASQVMLVQTGYGVSADQADEIATAYTNNGRVQHVTDANGNRTTYEYDGHDRPTKTRFPLPSTPGTSSTTDYEQLTLDGNGNVTNRRLRDGQNIAFTYDALNRVTNKNLPGSELDVTYTYDLLNRLTAASTSQRVSSFTYDALGRILSTANVGTAIYQYDAAGRRTRMTYPVGSGLQIGYTYLVTGEVTEIRENPDGSNFLLGQYAYDDRGRRTSLTRGNGTITTYSYDPVSRLSQIFHEMGGPSHDVTLDFTYDPAGGIVSNTRSNDLYAWTGHYAVNRNYGSDGLNRYTSAGSITPTYDFRGNLTSAGTTTYGYTSENRLVSAGSVSMRYDPLGRLSWSNTSPETNFEYDGFSLVGEAAAFVARRYVHGPGVDDPLVWYEGTGLTDRRWYHADERGSIIAISNSSGNVTSINAYDEYGIPGGGNAGKFQYTGQTWLTEIGMYYYRARMYSPTLGRFLQTDPIGYGDGLNLHAYVGNDPVNSTDPLGLEGENILVTGSRCPLWTICHSSGDFDLPGPPILNLISNPFNWLQVSRGPVSGSPSVQNCESAITSASFIAARGGLHYDTALERAALRAWHFGRTSILRLGPEHLARITAYTRRYRGNISRTPMPSESYDPPGSRRRGVFFGAHFGPPEYDALLGTATVIFDRNNNAIGLEDSFDFNDKPSYDLLTRAGMGLVRQGRRNACGTSGDFRITAGTGR